ncbi:ribonuclease-3 family protein [Anaerobacterium chartisolvens]|uniref:Mini-ribonuclease 3 n=1 Tax=Anaerobacterium chartisolvens TaxID=1297424 RepID=A0A369BGW4_9FIRM|nr:Mini-ribonuclease 3 [Anaerobacterium chartisolvens]RCX18924.1 ribonuclease-3 family protein [Anaerobacterium chartisolvens]
MIDGYFKGIFDKFNLNKKDPGQYNPLVLAYIGDAVYEVFIRTFLIHNGNSPVHKLHKQSIGFVKAKAQSDIIHLIWDNLDSEEQNIVRRGRNAKSGTIPKNADVTEYKYATGFEALVGFLFLKEDNARLMDILSMSVSGRQGGI